MLNRFVLCVAVLAGTSLTMLPANDAQTTSKPAVSIAPAVNAKPAVGNRKAGKSAANASKKALSAPKKELFSGKVVLLQDALKRRGIKSNEEFKDQVVLETASGELIPIVPDWRGRAFYQDKRLRDRKVELVGYRRKGVPYLQVLMVFTFDEKAHRQYFDYWCDICSIPMYEIKRCECCQGPIRMRFQTQELPEYLHGESASKSAAAKILKKSP